MNLDIDLFTVKKIKSPTKKSKEPSFMSGVYKVLIADITLSFDNVLGVAGAAKEHYLLLLFGLVLSVILVGALATYFAKLYSRSQMGWICWSSSNFISSCTINYWRFNGLRSAYNQRTFFASWF